MKSARYLIGNIIVALLAATAPVSAQPGEQSHTFLSLIQALDKAEPIDRSALERALGHKLQCTKVDPRSGRFDCGADNLQVGSVKIGKVDFRAGGFGSLLGLEDLAGDCFQVTELDGQFDRGFDHQACADAICWYRTYPRGWGRLSAKLGRNSDAKCAKSIILNVDSNSH